MMSDPPFDKMMLIDDCDTDNFISKMAIEISSFAKTVLVHSSAQGALMYFMKHMDEPSAWPELIFLDLNMPLVDGFVFLYEFERFPQEVRDHCEIIILSSSDNFRDKERVIKHQSVVKFITKPLTEEILEELKIHFGKIK